MPLRLIGFVLNLLGVIKWRWVLLNDLVYFRRMHHHWESYRWYLLPLLLGFFFPPPAGAANLDYRFTPPLEQAYHLITMLRLSEGQQLLEEVKKDDPDNLITDYLENYIDFFTLFISENYQDYRLRSQKLETRMNRLGKGDASSAYHQFIQAEVLLQWAIVRLKFEEYYPAYTEVRRAYRLLERNQRQFPGFVANLKSLGILHALVGTVPDRFKGLFSFFSGMRGTIRQGREEIEQVLAYSEKEEFIFREETLVEYAFLLLHLKNEGEEAWDLLETRLDGVISNPLLIFVKASIAMHTGRNDEAITLLEKKPADAAYFPFYYLDFILGLAKLRRLDPDADQPLLKFVNRFHGRLYIKEAYQKLSWFALLNHQNAKQELYRQSCLTEGSTLLDEDANAFQEAKSTEWPEIDLLRAQLLFDGGYYLRALKAVRNAPDHPTEFRLEKTYRSGRIYHAMGNVEAARKDYLETLDIGSSSGKYFACNAALLLGQIAEQEGKWQEARTYYERCLTMEPDSYKTGLHQKAKAGINRLEGR